MTQPLALWTAATPNGWKVSIMIEELREIGIVLPSIEVITVDIMNGQQFSDAFTAISANQKIPGLVHGDIRLMESCAILQYLGEQFPSSLYPSGADRYDVLQWLTWQAAGLGPTFGNKLSYTRYMADVPDEQKVHPLTRFNVEAQRLLRVLDKQLEGKVLFAARTSPSPTLRFSRGSVDTSGAKSILRCTPMCLPGRNAYIKDPALSAASLMA